jgi:hypothetical protein
MRICNCTCCFIGCGFHIFFLYKIRTWIEGVWEQGIQETTDLRGWHTGNTLVLCSGGTGLASRLSYWLFWIRFVFLYLSKRIIAQNLQISHDHFFSIPYRYNNHNHLSMLTTEVQRTSWNKQAVNLTARTVKNGGKLYCKPKPQRTVVLEKEKNLTTPDVEISGSHGGKYKDGCLLGHCAV